MSQGYVMMTDQQEDALREPCEMCGGHVALVEFAEEWIDRSPWRGGPIRGVVMVVQCDECGARETR